MDDPLGPRFAEVFAARRREADAFYQSLTPAGATPDEARVIRHGYASLLWSKQFYHYVVQDWLLSMPDKWEYPWYAAWDLAFQMVPFAVVDPEFAKQQLVLFLREWYMHPNGQLPAYEFAFSDVNPPVHAWACWRVYKLTGARGARDRHFLERVFGKLVFNFSWWVNRKDPLGHHIFSGGFLGLDNIGVFDRNRPLPTGGHLQQADGTAWMAFFCGTMLVIALELARENPAYEDLASKFFEHFIAIADAMNTLGGTGLWDEEDGFYYDQVLLDDKIIRLRVRSLVGLVPLFVVGTLEEEVLQLLPGFTKRMSWFLDNRHDLVRSMRIPESPHGKTHRQFAIPSRERLVRVLRYVLDEDEFLSPYGIRSVSKVHRERPFVLRIGGEEYRVDYEPGEGTTSLFGGNSNWRGPIWFPMNYLLVEALHRYHFFYGDTLKVECPTGSGRYLTLEQVALELARRQCRVFLPDDRGRLPCHGDDERFAADPHWRDLPLFYEHFHGDTGRGLGASHQTGWTALAVRYVDEQIRRRMGLSPLEGRLGLTLVPGAGRS